jgi:uncharacterized protein (TIGR00251 family)
MLRSVLVKPNARSSAVVAWDAATRTPTLAIAAPPMDGKANAEVERFVAERLGVPKSRVKVVGGAAARQKRLEVPDDVDWDAAFRLA